MPQYTLSAPERQIIVSWLFEAVGYLDVAVNDQGVSARQALALTPTLDVTAWIRTQAKAPQTDQRDWDGTGMVWWIWKHSNLNVTPPTRPPETALWVGILQEWDASIDAGFGRIPQNDRNSNTVGITTEDGTMSTMPAGNQLASQQSMINKVLGVLQ